MLPSQFNHEKNRNVLFCFSLKQYLEQDNGWIELTPRDNYPVTNLCFFKLYVFIIFAFLCFTNSILSFFILITKVWGPVSPDIYFFVITPFGFAGESEHVFAFVKKKKKAKIQICFRLHETQLHVAVSREFGQVTQNRKLLEQEVKIVCVADTRRVHFSLGVQGRTVTQQPYISAVSYSNIFHII